MKCPFFSVMTNGRSLASPDRHAGPYAYRSSDCPAFHRRNAAAVSGSNRMDRARRLLVVARMALWASRFASTRRLGAAGEDDVISADV
jgi:hypothetical protein